MRSATSAETGPIEVPPELGVTPRATCTSQQGDVCSSTGFCRSQGGLIVPRTGCGGNICCSLNFCRNAGEVCTTSGICRANGGIFSGIGGCPSGQTCCAF